MAKGQKRTTRETRKPKRDKPKAPAAPRTFLGVRPAREAPGPRGKGSVR
jgi:hypothetical protein